MKLLYLHNIALTEGMSTNLQVISVCNSLHKNGLEVILAMPDPRIKSCKLEKIFKNVTGGSVSFQVFLFKEFSKFRRLNKYTNHFRIKKILKKTQPDICFVRSPLFFCKVIKLGYPVIFESHNNLLHNRSKIINCVLTKKLIKATKSTCCKIFITISYALGQFWKKKGVKRNKILCLHDGFDESLFKKVYTLTEAKKKLGLNVRQKVTVYTGSLFKNRGIENIIELAKCFPKVIFLMIGGPETKKNEYSKMALNMKVTNIKFLGHINHDNIPNYLYAADILLALWTKEVPTINYCSPLKLFEYMASGRLILAHDFPTIREVLTNGLTAILIKPDSIDDLKKKFKLALNLDNYIFISNNSRKLAFRKYSWEVRTKTIINSLKKSMT